MTSHENQALERLAACRLCLQSHAYLVGTWLVCKLTLPSGFLCVLFVNVESNMLPNCNQRHKAPHAPAQLQCYRLAQDNLTWRQLTASVCTLLGPDPDQQVWESKR